MTLTSTVGSVPSAESEASVVKRVTSVRLAVSVTAGSAPTSVVMYGLRYADGVLEVQGFRWASALVGVCPPAGDGDGWESSDCVEVSCLVAGGKCGAESACDVGVSA